MSNGAGQIGKRQSKIVQLTYLPSSGSAHRLLHYKCIANDNTKKYLKKITQSWADWEASTQKSLAYQSPQLRKCAQPLMLQ